MKLNKYRSELTHDQGKVYIINFAENKQQAIAQIMKAEGCPQRAILSTKLIKK